jgi:ATP-binding cassette subfamily F protein uup
LGLTEAVAGTAAPGEKTSRSPARGGKLTNKERAELELLLATIEALESEQAELTVRLADPETCQREPGAVPAIKARLEASGRKLAAAFARWEELETVRTDSA